jgi:hypothetical protein
MEERVAEAFRRRIKESQPWFPQVDALAEIDRLGAFSDQDLPGALGSAVDAMSDHDFEVFSGTLILLSVAARARSSDPDRVEASRLRTRLEGLRRVTAQASKPQHDPAVGVERRKIFARYSEVAGRVAQGVATPQVITELREVLDMQERLQASVSPDSADWRDLQEQRAYVTESVGRAYRILRDGPAAIEEYGRAEQIWRGLGQDDQAARCTAVLAELALMEDADVDAVRGALVAIADGTQPPARSAGPVDEAGPPDAAAFARAQALTSLAALFLDARDDYQARRRLDDAAGLLEALGYVDPRKPGLDAAFASWAEKAPGPDASRPSDQRFLRVVTAVLGMWTGLLTTAAALDGDSDGSIGRLIGSLGGYAREIRPQAEQARKELAPMLARLGIDLPADTGKAAEGWADAGAAAGRLDTICAKADELKAELDRRTESGEDTSGLAPTAQLWASAAFEIGMPGLGGGFIILAADAFITARRFQDAVDVLEEGRGLLLTVAGFAAADRRASSIALLTREALALANLGEWARLSDVCGTGIEEVEVDRYKVSAPHMEDTYLRDRINLYRVGVFAAWKLYDDDKTGTDRAENLRKILERAELSKAHSGLGWLFSPGTLEAKRSDDTSAAVRARFDELTDTQDPAVTAARRRAIWDELMAGQAAQRGGASALPVFSLESVQQSLREDEAVLYYYWMNSQAMLVIGLDNATAEVERVLLGQPAPHETPPRSLLDDLVGRASTPDPPGDDFAPDLAKFADVLLPAKVTRLFAGKQRLLLSPHKVLHQLPLHTAPWQGEPLCVNFAVTVVPNLTSLLLRYSPGGQGVLAVGIAGPETGGDADTLVNAPIEAREVAALYRDAVQPATTLVDDEATWARVRDLASQGLTGGENKLGCLHLSTHGTSELSDTPMESALRLADRPVDGLDIARWELAADRVVLSACWSGQQAIWDRSGADELIGDEMLGLPAAFMAAGAHQVIGTLWKVGDASALRVTRRLHEELIAGQPAETALRRAILAERDVADNIADWGAFQLIAIGRERPAGTPS